MLEKRRYPRLDLALPVTLRHQGRLIPATLLNVSCGGMCLTSETGEIESQKSVEVIFDLDTTQRDLSLRGRITRVETSPTSPTTLGVQFSNLFSESHKAIQTFLNKRFTQ